MARTPLRRTSSSPHLRRCGERRRLPSRVRSRPGRTERPSRYEAVSPTTIPSHAASHAAQSGSAPACAHQPAPKSASSSGSGRTSVERTAPKMINAAYTAAKVDRNPSNIMAPVYDAARWLISPDLMTVFGPLFRRGPRVPVTRERWELSDGDFIDVDRMSGPTGAPLLLALHGLEGSSSAHYIRGLLAQARRRGWGALALNFRGCPGDMNRLVASHLSGAIGDPDEARRRHRLHVVHTPFARLFVAGESLGNGIG